jgi:sulfide:quinone oxidoreductase
MQRVLIVGGGSGGTILANKLNRRHFDMTLISDSVEHMFQPGLLYVAFAHGSSNIVREEWRLLPHHVHFVQHRVTHIDLAQSKVTTKCGRQFDGDMLVLATGADTAPAQNPGLVEVNARSSDYHSSVAQAQKLAPQSMPLKAAPSRSVWPRRSASAHHRRSRVFCSSTGCCAKRA